MTELASVDEWQQAAAYLNMKEVIDESVFDYFDATQEERAFVRETVNVLMPSIRPRGYSGLNTPTQRPATPDNIGIYAHTLAIELTNWRKRTKGKGKFDVSVVSSDQSRDGPAGIVRIQFNDKKTADGSSSTRVDNDAVLETFSELRRLGLSVVPAGEALWFVPDTFIWSDGAVFVVRSLIRRNWTIRQALRDAERIVRNVQEGQVGKIKLVAA